MTTLIKGCFTRLSCWSLCILGNATKWQKKWVTKWFLPAEGNGKGCIIGVMVTWQNMGELIIPPCHVLSRGNKIDGDDDCDGTHTDTVPATTSFTPADILLQLELQLCFRRRPGWCSMVHHLGKYVPVVTEGTATKTPFGFYSISFSIQSTTSDSW